MSDPRIQAAVAAAVSQAFDAWAEEHPTLASVVDRLAMSEQATESLRKSPQYAQALTDFNKSSSETALLSQLLEAVGPIVQSLLR